MPHNPPPLPPLETKDSEHLRLVAVFHYVMAGFSLLGLGGLAFHYLFLNAFLGNSAMWEQMEGGPPPAELLAIFKWFYLFFGVVIVMSGVLELISARMIQKRRGRMFSLVIAGVNCLQFPFGTALGVFTFVVLLRPSVQRLYEQAAAETAERSGRF